MRSCASPGGSSGPGTAATFGLFTFACVTSQSGATAIGTSSIEADGSHKYLKEGES